MKVTIVCKKSEQKILYAEANKECVDIIMSFLLLPIGSSMKLTQGSANAGVANVFNSVLGMDEALIQFEKKALVDPKTPEGFMETLIGVKHEVNKVFKPSDHTYYRCSSGRVCPAICMDDNTQKCTNCGSLMNVVIQVIAPTLQQKQPVQGSNIISKGFVKENISFLITDDLQIYPLSAAKSVAIMNLFRVASVSDLEIVELDINATEVLQLLKMSLTSTTVLNDVFKPRLPRFVSQLPPPPPQQQQSLQRQPLR